MLKQKKIWLLQLGLAAAGALLATYTIHHHLLVKDVGVSGAFCNVNSIVNCDRIASSQFSEFLSLPLGVWGVIYFLTLFILALAWRLPRLEKGQKLALEQGYFFLTFVGLAISIILFGISSVLLFTYCLSCIGIYLLCFAQAGLLFVNRNNYLPFRLKIASKAAFYSLSPVLLFAVTSYQIYLANRPPAAPLPMEQVSSLIPIERTTEVEDYRRGSDKASAVLVAFSDFQCPACQRMHNTLEELGEIFKDDVLIVYKNFPLDISCNPYMSRALHPLACKMAIMARCAGQQGLFWDYADKLFANQSEVDEEERLLLLGEEIGMSRTKMETCLNDEGILQKIRADLELGKSLGVRGTPSVFINGKPFEDRTLAALQTELEKIISKR